MARFRERSPAIIPTAPTIVVHAGRLGPLAAALNVNVISKRVRSGVNAGDGGVALVLARVAAAYAVNRSIDSSPPRQLAGGLGVLIPLAAGAAAWLATFGVREGGCVRHGDARSYHRRNGRLASRFPL